MPITRSRLLGYALAAVLGALAVVGCSRTPVPASQPQTAARQPGQSGPQASAPPPGAAPQPAAAQPRTSGPPNVFIYLIDTLRADHLGVYGYRRRPTSPTIDGLASQGVVFEQAYSPAPWTLPTVVSLMTGVYPCEHGVVVDGLKVPAELPTLAERLKSVGYRTISLYANAYAGPVSGLNRGFDVCRAASTKLLLRMVRKQLAKVEDQPFLLYVHVIDPHNPADFAPRKLPDFREVPSEQRARINRAYRLYRRLSRVDYSAKRPIGTTDNTPQQLEAIETLNSLREDYIELYDAATAAADARLAVILMELKQRRLLGNTLIIVISDHGEEFGEHGGWLHDQSAYEELLRVPLLIRLPRNQFSGRRIQRPVSLVDLMPTICDAIGHPELAGDLSGRSLMPLIRGERPDVSPDQPQIVGLRINVKKYFRPWKQTRGDINVALRSGPFKAIWNLEPDTLELYDLTRDVQEQVNLADREPDLAHRLREAARNWYQQCAASAHTPKGSAGQLDERTREMLQKLGYID